MGVVKLSTAGIVNYQKYSNLLAGESPFIPSSFQLLETQVLSSSAASVTFSGLSTYAADYKHLQIRATVKSTRSGFAASVWSLRLNGDTGSNYKAHSLAGYGSSVTSYVYGETDRIMVGLSSASLGGADSFAGSVIDILDPFNTSKNTTTRALNGVMGDGSARSIELASGLWMNTQALTSITLFDSYGNLGQYSRFSLYGIKAGA